MSTARSDGPRWPARLKQLCIELCHPPDKAARDSIREEVWLLLNSSIWQYLQIHVPRLGRAAREDLEDIASQKSLDLIRKLESKTWDVADRSPAEIAAFLSTVARNGLIDLLRETGRRVEPREEDRPAWDVGEVAKGGAMTWADSPELLVERKEFAQALRMCAQHLKPQWRLVWFLRVFCEMSSKEIAAHPDVTLRASHVDVLMKRARDAIRDCMYQKGYEPQDMPPGTFLEIWRAFQLEEA